MCPRAVPELDTVRVHPRVGSGWVGSGQEIWTHIHFCAAYTLRTRENENRQRLDAKYKQWRIVGVVVREHNISGVPCKQYTT